MTTQVPANSRDRVIHRPRRSRRVQQHFRCADCGMPLFMAAGSGNFPICAAHPDALQVEETAELGYALYYLDKLRVLDGSYFLTGTNRLRTPTREQAIAWAEAGRETNPGHWVFPVGGLMISHPGVTREMMLLEAIPLWERWGRVGLPERVLPDIETNPESALKL